MVENKDKTVCSWMKTPYKSTAFTILDLSGEARKDTLASMDDVRRLHSRGEHEHDIDEEWKE
jgi:hypothetical protein